MVGRHSLDSNVHRPQSLFRVEICIDCLSLLKGGLRVEPRRPLMEDFGYLESIHIDCLYMEVFCI